MKKVILSTVLILSGCAVHPQDYDLSTSGTYPPIKSKKNISNLEVVEFKYEPHINLSQNAISHLGCLPCQSDGSTSGVVFTSPINEIVQSEVENALQEVIVPTANSSCKLSATIHMAAWDVMDGDSIVDLTYMLMQDDQIKFIKRIRGHYDSGIFELHSIDRFLANASRKSVGLLVNNNEFLGAVSKNCS